MRVYTIPGAQSLSVNQQSNITDASVDTTASQSAASAINDILATLRKAGVIG